tara:strand:+ start:161 stop:718 length:558 start_codon:yes stop_codon:yes gene_type:complete
MNYKGQILSDNLTQSQIDLFKYLIDQGLTTDEIIKMYRTPDSADDIGENILKKNYGGMANIEQMTAPLSRRGETQLASDPDPMAEKWDMYQDKIKDGSYTGTWEDFLLDFEDAVDIPYAKRKDPQGIMQLASASSGDDIIQSAIIWAAGLPQFGSIDAVVKSLQDGSTDINGLVNAYMDARVDSN